MGAESVGRKQLDVLRLLLAHRFADTSQIAALAFEDSGPRACQACLTRLHRKGLVTRFELGRGGLDGGRSAYVYGLSPRGARVLCDVTGIPLAKIACDTDAEAARRYLARHQLAVNRCLIALRDSATRGAPARLRQWYADPHLRLRFHDGRRWRIVHPDGLALLRVDGSDRWYFFEVDRSTQAIGRYKRKVAQYARFYLSDAWQDRFASFPELRITTTHVTRVGELRMAARAALRSLDPARRAEVGDHLAVAIALDEEFLANPLGAVWLPALGDGITWTNLWNQPDRTITGK